MKRVRKLASIFKLRDIDGEGNKHRACFHKLDALEEPSEQERRHTGARYGSKADQDARVPRRDIEEAGGWEQHRATAREAMMAGKGDELPRLAERADWGCRKKQPNERSTGSSIASPREGTRAKHAAEATGRTKQEATLRTQLERVQEAEWWEQ